MTSAPATARILVPRRTATVEVAARAALEMTASCFVWLERSDDGIVICLEERAAGLETDLEARFDEHLDRISTLARVERQTRPLRSAITARALGPRPEPRQQPQVPELDPETEAEIEKLLAEIESDDWLDDAGEIAKTWEERFGKGPVEDGSEGGRS
jgi:hypothetical protein